MAGIDGGRVMAESDTAADGLERKLATILSADVAAYSRLMAEDEERTLQTFRAHKEVFEKLVQLHRGRVFNTAGDAILAEFGSPVETLADAYNALHDEELSLFPDAHETLDRLKELGVRLALITNGAAEPQRAKVVRFALEHRFDHIQIEGEHGFGKPEERAYTHAMATLGVGPHETWMVGDNLEWEIMAPQRLGIYAIWHDGYSVGLPPDSPSRPDRIIRRLSELLL
jgi:putative hydrolase of the HAD superfamily